MTAFFGIFFTVEDWKYWDSITTGPINLYAGKIYYPGFIIAGVVLA